MKNLMKKIFVMVFVCVLVMVNMLPTQAATSKSGIKKLVDQMYNYEYSILPVSQKKVIKLLQKEKAKATALSLEYVESEGVGRDEFGDYVLFKVNTDSFTKASLNLFGKKMSINSLPMKSTQDGILDAYRLKDETPVVYFMSGETDCDFVVNNTKIKKKSAKTYSVIKNIYFGYWGNNDGKSNFKITYTVQKNLKSDYGFVITKMVVEPLT